jgi:hypothetical protein
MPLPHPHIDVHLKAEIEVLRASAAVTTVFGSKSFREKAKRMHGSST